MIPRAEAGTFLALDRGKISPLILKNGETVNVSVLNKFPDGSAKIGIRGFIFTAMAPKGIKKGAVAKMIVRLTENKLFLTPLPQENTQIVSKSDFFSQAGVPKNPVFQSLLTFFQELGLKIEIPTLERIAQSAKRISRDEKKTAFLAAMLDEKGVVIDDRAFQKLYDTVFPEDKDDKQTNSHNQETAENDDYGESTEDDVLKAINHIHGGNFHWIVVPFEKKFTNSTARGSCSMLLNLTEKTCKKVTLRAGIGEANWTFVLENGVCKFQVAGNKKVVTEPVLENMLSEEFQQRYLEIKASYGIEENLLKPIDISV